jgi:hypothetical protein
VTPGARGIRIRMREGLPMDADHPGLNRAFAAAGKHGLPVNLLCWGILDKGLPHIQRHPDTVIVIDHLGFATFRPPVPPTFRPAELLDLAPSKRQGEDQRPARCRTSRSTTTSGPVLWSSTRLLIGAYTDDPHDRHADQSRRGTVPIPDACRRATRRCLGRNGATSPQM